MAVHGWPGQRYRSTSPDHGATPAGDPYKPSAIRGYEELRLRLLPDLGGAKLSEIRRADVQALVDRLMAAGHGASTIRNTLLPQRVIFRRAVVRGRSRSTRQSVSS